jgi:hypothetical protein
MQSSDPDKSLKKPDLKIISQPCGRLTQLPISLSYESVDIKKMDVSG